MPIYRGVVQENCIPVFFVIQTPLTFTGSGYYDKISAVKIASIHPHDNKQGHPDNILNTRAILHIMLHNKEYYPQKDKR
jgi:hypothetical protein